MDRDGHAQNERDTTRTLLTVAAVAVLVLFAVPAVGMLIMLGVLGTMRGVGPFGVWMPMFGTGGGMMLLFALMEQAAAVQGLRVVRIERDRVIEFGARLFGFSGPYQRLTALRGGLRVAHLGFSRSRLGNCLLVRRRRPRPQIERAPAERDCDQQHRRGRARA